MLHITNGDSAAELLRRAEVPGDVLPWRDVLHEGPVPAGLSLAQLSPLRARFVADQGWADYEAVMADFARRDDQLEAAGEHEEVVLWFEHDLYDQLQLIQLLHFFSGHEHTRLRLSLVCIGSHPGVERFIGLGQLTPEQMASLFDDRLPVTAAQLELGRRAWEAFRAPDPREIEALLRLDTSDLPFLRAALRRYLEQFPSTRDGLCRTERQIVSLVATGLHTPRGLFHAVQDLEPAPFLGDVTFWGYLGGLCGGEEPLLRRADHAACVAPGGAGEPEAVLVLTEQGAAVREGRVDWIRLRGGIDRWLGGVHLEGEDAAWRWDPEAERLVEWTGGEVGAARAG